MDQEGDQYIQLQEPIEVDDDGELTDDTMKPRSFGATAIGDQAEKRNLLTVPLQMVGPKKKGKTKISDFGDCVPDPRLGDKPAKFDHCMELGMQVDYSVL